MFSAGNYRELGGDANYNEFLNTRFTIAVAACDENGEITTFSSPGTPILITAPGEVIHTTDMTGADGFDAGDYTDVDGTSFSAPIISGVVALMLEANPGLGYRDVQEILAYSATQTDPADASWKINSATNWNGGGLHVSNNYGFGLVDATAAVRLAESWQLVKPTAAVLSNEEVVSVSSGSISRTISNDAVQTHNLRVKSGLNIDHVEVSLNLSYFRMGDLKITLVSPTGMESVLVDTPGHGSDWTAYNTAWSFSTTHDWGETGVGIWSLKIEDMTPNFDGTLRGWSLRLYGDTLSTHNTYIYTDEYGTLPNGDRNTLTDTAGTDTFNAAAVSTGITLDMAPGGVGSLAGNPVNFGATTTIENAIGGDGDDSLTGNSAHNILFGQRGEDFLSGLAGSDTLDGGQDADAMFGGTGNDVYMVDDGADSVTENPEEGTDTIQATLSATLPANVEKLKLLGSDHLSGTGNNLNNAFYGNTGNNTLDGQGGNDTLSGGTGDDTYQFSNLWGQDRIVDSGGRDTLDFSNVNTAGVTANLNSSTTTHVVKLGSNTITWKGEIINNITGSPLNDTMVGNAYANLLIGLDGNDTLLGSSGNDTFVGGEGDDLLKGGKGNDQYRFGSGDLGFDIISDATGNDLCVFEDIEIDDVLFTAISLDANARLDALEVTMGLDFSVTLAGYFNNLTSSTDTIGAGAGAMTLLFDDGSLEFSDVMLLLS